MHRCQKLTIVFLLSGCFIFLAVATSDLNIYFHDFCYTIHSVDAFQEIGYLKILSYMKAFLVMYLMDNQQDIGFNLTYMLVTVENLEC